MNHKSVLLKESIGALNLGPEKVFLDATFGAGGHTKEALRQFPELRVVAIDQDPEVVAEAQTIHGVQAIRENFRNLDKAIRELGLLKVDAILFDLGISSDQLDALGRGFSFLRDEPLDMRMSGRGVLAKDILNSWNENALELVLRGFGEEKFSRKIAAEIVQRRKEKPFETTGDLVEAVLRVKPRNPREKIHPATKVFQAIRIAVNDELTSLELGLRKGFEVLNRTGRFAVISFHSLEDRIVKNFFKDLVTRGLAKKVGKNLKPIRPGTAEVHENPRSRSAKLRVIEKT